MTSRKLILELRSRTLWPNGYGAGLRNQRFWARSPAESFIDKDFSFVFWATQQRDPGTFFIYFALSVFVIKYFEILNLVWVLALIHSSEIQVLSSSILL
jgi:hypothetical protein